MIVGSAERLHERGVEDMVGSAGENAGPLECRQGERKTGVHGFYYRRAFRGNEVVESFVLRESSLTARETLSQSVQTEKWTSQKSKSRGIESSWQGGLKS